MAGQPSPDRLSADDARILGLESQSIAGHTLKLIALEPGAPLDLERLRESVAERLAAVPRACQRIEMPDDRPEQARWVVDRRFEIGAHVRRREGGAPIDEHDLWRVAGEVMSERLDHRRPLWSFDLLGPLADGREAIAARIHHAMADGISCLRLLSALLWDAEPEAPKRDPGETAVRAAERHRSRLRAMGRLPGAIGRELGGRGGRSPFDHPIGSARALGFAVAPLSQLRAIAGSRPGHVTVNDVLLAVVAGGLREWLGGAGELPRLRAQVPVSLHHRDEPAAGLGNRDSFLNVDLPLAEADPLRRLELINLETARRKSLGDAEELYDFFHAVSRFKHLDRELERLAGGPREFSLSISNVPGPPGPVTVSGRVVESLRSAAEPAARHALRISAISCAGMVEIGLCTDPGVLPGVEALAAAMQDSLASLQAAAA